MKYGWSPETYVFRELVGKFLLTQSFVVPCYCPPGSSTVVSRHARGGVGGALNTTSSLHFSAGPRTGATWHRRRRGPQRSRVSCSSPSFDPGTEDPSVVLPSGSFPSALVVWTFPRASESPGRRTTYPLLRRPGSLSVESRNPVCRPVLTLETGGRRLQGSRVDWGSESLPVRWVR